ncbi:hypothetical protein CRG98_042246 [Punica granatum]|uniref:Uncharacterized protein n=1 Tax=Punica granatum TaxID=22663 RepID=A0A2I0I066_PUNGR|nr:hypothetical protein CRG98_042246 [Punica granatum]
MVDRGGPDRSPLLPESLCLTLSVKCSSIVAAQSQALPSNLPPLQRTNASLPSISSITLTERVKQRDSEKEGRLTGASPAGHCPRGLRRSR